MSGEMRFDAEEAMPVALDLVESLKPFVLETPAGFPWDRSHLITIAGSLRRQKEDVGDIEILYVPRFEDRQADLFSNVAVNLATEKIAGMLADGVLEKRKNKAGYDSSWGEKNKHAIHTESGIPVDLFATCVENWFVSLVIRTVSKGTVLSLTKGAISIGRSLHAYGDGVSERRPDGSYSLIRANSEEDVFRLCNVPYREAHRR